jgi:hypothetical protein
VSDPDFRFEQTHRAPMPEVSPSRGIRVFNSTGQEIVVIPPDLQLYKYLMFRLHEEIRRMGG